MSIQEVEISQAEELINSAFKGYDARKRLIDIAFNVVPNKNRFTGKIKSLIMYCDDALTQQEIS